MKKVIGMKLAFLSFAFAGLFFIGNNVIVKAQSKNNDSLIGIICAQNPRVGATCWTCLDGGTLSGPCIWTGYMTDTCCQKAK